MKNKIGWCSETWNPVRGCLNNCSYCYARIIAKRFWIGIYNIELKHYYKKHPTWAWTGDHLSGLKDFKPTFLEAQFDKEFPENPQKIFVGSMSEIHYWNEVWMEKVLERVKLYPQHIFQFLTKYPDIYFGKYEFPKNCWLGTTITGSLNKEPMGYYTEKAFNLNKDNLKFISFEPLLERIEPNFKVSWVIIGAETGTRKGRVIPKKAWIERIVDYCRDKDIPIYLKNSLREIYPVEIKEFPGIKAELLF